MRKVYKSIGVYFLIGFAIACLFSLGYWLFFSSAKRITTEESSAASASDDPYLTTDTTSTMSADVDSTEYESPETEGVTSGSSQSAPEPLGSHSSSKPNSIEESSPDDYLVAPEDEESLDTHIKRYRQEVEKLDSLRSRTENELNETKPASKPGNGLTSRLLRRQLIASEFQILKLQHKIDSLEKLQPEFASEYSGQFESAQENQQVMKQASDMESGGELKALIRKLFPASIAFSTPDMMYVGEPQPITLIIDPGRTPAQAKQELAKSLAPMVSSTKAMQTLTADSIRIGDIVEAHLSGSDFIINEISPQTQLVKKGEPTEWNWEVTPQSEDTHWLHLVINTKIYYNGENQNYALQTYHRNIKVDVTMGTKISRFAEKYSGTLPFIFGTASIFGFWGWFMAWIRNWLDRRKTLNTPKPIRSKQRRSSKKTPPSSPPDAES